ncbi:hypothetical protein Bca4012_009915 [Brassica carinata]
MSKSNIIRFVVLLLSFKITALVALQTRFSRANLREMELKCGIEECLMKSTSDTHLDYIYIMWPPSPPKQHGVKEGDEKCETEECLMKTTSDAHLDYINTHKSPPQHKANP